MKLNLNQPAMEWLWNQLSDDVKLELSTNVVQSFARHHLKGVINNEFYQQLLKFVTNELNAYKKLLIEEIKSTVIDTFGTLKRDQFSGKITNIFLTKELVDEIKSFVYMHRSEIIEQSVKERLAELDPELDKKIEAIVDHRVAELLKEKVDKLVKSL